MKYKLNSQISQIAVNKELYDKISLFAKERNLPVNDLNEIINEYEVFNNERQASPYYRISGTINPLFTNVLFNTTGNYSYGSFMTNPLFRDRSYPPDAVDFDQDEDLTYKEAISEHLVEKDGWYGYYEPNIALASNCLFYDMEPTRERFNLTPTGSTKNWDLTVTYPYRKLIRTNSVIDGGILIVDKQIVTVNGREMVCLGTPIKHNLSFNATVRLSGIADSTLNGDYKVTKLGLDNGDLSTHYFCVDIDPNLFNLTLNTRMIRIYLGQPSEYYFRVFKKIKTKETLIMENDDYEIYPLAFSKNIFNDKMCQFVINEDIDISNLVDHLNRPLSEIYISLIKNDSNGMFTPIYSGLDMPFIENISLYKNIADIRRITDDVVNTHSPLESSLTINNDEFIGDVAEFNKYEVKETILSDVYHRFNTNNRIAGGIVNDTSGVESSINMGVRHEGYMYKPFYKMKIREFSNYIEQGDVTSDEVPTYAVDLGDGRYLWRDLLDIGFNDGSQKLLDYPFLNGNHYLYTNIIHSVKRQDPFGKYGLFYKTFPKDTLGDEVPDNIIVKNTNTNNHNECK